MADAGGRGRSGGERPPATCEGAAWEGSIEAALNWDAIAARVERPHVPSQVDEFSQQHLAGCGIFDLNVDIENQIAHLLDPAN